MPEPTPADRPQDRERFYRSVVTAVGRRLKPKYGEPQRHEVLIGVRASSD